MNIDHLRFVLGEAEASIVEQLRQAPGNEAVLARKRQLDWANVVPPDNRRLLAAQEPGLKGVPVDVVHTLP